MPIIFTSVVIVDSSHLFEPKVMGNGDDAEGHSGCLHRRRMGTFSGCDRDGHTSEGIQGPARSGQSVLFHRVFLVFI